jgi:anti-sigma factor RsiW
MKPVEPWELSGLLDGELDAARAREVEAQLASDPALRAEFAELSRLDAACRAAAASAAFAPAIRMPRESIKVPGFVLIGAVALLVAWRIAPRLLEGAAPDFVLQLPVLALVLAGVMWLAKGDLQEPEPSPA